MRVRWSSIDLKESTLRVRRSVAFVSSDVASSARVLIQVINLLPKVECLPHMEQNHFQQLKVVGPEIGSIGISAKPNQAILLLMLANNADQRCFFL